VRRQPSEYIHEIGGVAGLRVALFLDREDRHGQFGEILERQDVEPALGRQLDWRVEIVAPKPAAVADANRHEGVLRASEFGIRSSG
jgi:hypothetical protein